MNGAARARAVAFLTAPVDIASLAAFRALFGLVMGVAALRTLAKGWVGQLYLAPAFHFTYPHLGFVRPWPGVGMYVHFGVMALAALGIAVGYRYRWCAIVFFLTFTYAELIDKALYLNHYYLVSLLAGWLIFLPAARAYSVDARRAPERSPAGVRAALPRWTLAGLRIQIGLVYFFAGLAKLNRDWLVDAQPLRIWLAAYTDLPLVGPLLALPEVAFAASWAAALFDLTIVGFLLARRTRRPAFAVLVGFHLITGLLFPIGMFPWIMIVAATVFFPPGWPRARGPLQRQHLPAGESSAELLRALNHQSPSPPSAGERVGARGPRSGHSIALEKRASCGLTETAVSRCRPADGPLLTLTLSSPGEERGPEGGRLATYRRHVIKAEPEDGGEGIGGVRSGGVNGSGGANGSGEASSWRPGRWLAPLVLVHLAVQVALPLRQQLQREPSAWSGRGFNFAWNVMLAEKSGQVRFAGRDRRSGAEVAIDPTAFLLPFQERAMAQDPEMVRALALYAARALDAQGRDVAIYADAVASLNGRPARPLIDPQVDLTRPLPAGWIRPLD